MGKVVHAAKAPKGNQYLSLREIGRRLGIPPSTVVYYKDRFERFIPSVEGRGRRKKYPAEVLDIFKGIREMYDNNWSADQIERELALRFGKVAEAVRRESKDLVPLGVSEGQSPDLVRTLTDVLDKMSGMLETQAIYKGEIDSLKGEVGALQAELGKREQEYAASVRQMESDLESLRKENKQLVDYIHKNVRRGNPLHSKPSEDFLAMPLVIRSERGEYLGVASDSKGTFTCKSLVIMMQKSASAVRSVEMDWDRDRDFWVLRVQVVEKANADGQHLVLMLKETVTPSRNKVARLEHMIVDGQEVPDKFLLTLFRQIRDSFIT